MYGVTFSVDQWLLLAVVFLLTLAALYGLGMMLASLFLLWGREACHLTQLFTEPVYFVSGLNFPVGRLGLLGALAIATIPLAVGLDAMRQLAFVGTAVPFGTPSPEVEALILVAMTRRLPRWPRAGCSGRWSGWPAARAACRSAGSDPGGAPVSAAGLASPEWGGFDPARTRGRRLRATRGAASGRRPAGLADGGELDRPVPVLHLLGREAGGRGADPRRHARHRQRRRRTPSTARSS